MIRITPSDHGYVVFITLPKWIMRLLPSRSKEKDCHRCGHALCDHVKPGCGPFVEGTCPWGGCKCVLTPEEIAKAPRAKSYDYDGVPWRAVGLPISDAGKE